MTWIKPSLLWMAYRCGWATKAGQERVLAIEITRDGFEWALAHACLSHYEPETYPNHAAWSATKDVSPVRIQWDPERDLTLTAPSIAPFRLDSPAKRSTTTSTTGSSRSPTSRI